MTVLFTDLCLGDQHLLMASALNKSQGVTLSPSSAYLGMLPAGTYIFPKTGFASCNGNISKIVVFTAQEERDSTLELNISVWRPTGSTYEKLSECTIMQNLQGSEDMEGFEGYVRISVNVTAPMPVYKGDILGLSLPETDGSTAAPVLAHYDASENVGLTEEAEGCWNIDEGKLTNCHVIALAAHPVIAVYLADYEDGENWISEIQTDHVYIQKYHMKRLTCKKFTTQSHPSETCVL